VGTTKIIRVFPSKTNLTPTDDYAFYDLPGFSEMIPEHDEVHVCTVFTWDIVKAKLLQLNWQEITNKPVKIGGPAFNDPCTGDFVPGRYLRWGVTFSSKGCNNQCVYTNKNGEEWKCLVPEREGRLRELEIICPGNRIQDNAFAQCSNYQRRRVYDMLKTQKQVVFSGGIEAARLTEWDVEEMRSLDLHEIFLACDTKNALKPLERAIKMLHAGGIDLLTKDCKSGKAGEPARSKIRSYVLIGDDRKENEERLHRVWELGALPFAQLYKDKNNTPYSSDWEEFQRMWQRPAITRVVAKLA
jgi:hypothetical protein